MARKLKNVWYRLRKMLVDDLHQFYRWWSVQLTAGVLLLAELQEHLPELKEALPEGWYKYALIAILVARLIKQAAPK